MRNCFRTAKHVRHIHINHMKTAAQQGKIWIRLVAKELAVPRPRSAKCLPPGRDDEHRLAVHLEIYTLEAKPARTSAGELRCLTDTPGNWKQARLSNIHDCARALVLRLDGQRIRSRSRQNYATDLARQKNLEVAGFF